MAVYRASLQNSSWLHTQWFCRHVDAYCCTPGWTSYRQRNVCMSHKLLAPIATCIRTWIYIVITKIDYHNHVHIMNKKGNDWEIVGIRGGPTCVHESLQVQCIWPGRYHVIARTSMHWTCSDSCTHVRPPLSGDTLISLDGWLCQALTL